MFCYSYFFFCHILFLIVGSPTKTLTTPFHLCPVSAFFSHFHCLLLCSCFHFWFSSVNYWCHGAQMKTTTAAAAAADVFSPANDNDDEKTGAGCREQDAGVRPFEADSTPGSVQPRVCRRSESFPYVHASVGRSVVRSVRPCLAFFVPAVW